MAAGAQSETATWHIELDGEAATDALADEIAGLVKAGDLVTLAGDLGTGKTTFARALIRQLLGDRDAEVPSPTFTLMQIYAGPDFPIVHTDLYRIKSPLELVELGWEEAADGALVLVEWPERAGPYLTPDRLDITFDMDPGRAQNYRGAALTGYGGFSARLARAKAISTIFETSGWKEARRDFMQGDASSRLYERLIKPDGTRAVLMISPPRPDGPPVRYGKPYSAIARLAETITPFIAIDAELRRQGFSAPAIYAFDQSAGLAVIEDFGATPFTHGDEILFERYSEAAALLAALHAKTLPDTVPIDGDRPYRVPPYDIDALAIEVELLPDWYAAHVAKVSLSSGAKANFVNLWRHVLAEIVGQRATWTLRDFHSPNLIWLADRDGLARVGLLDFQDCVLGHPAYDLVSLLQDARITVSDDAELKLLSHYLRLRRDAEPEFDMGAFARAYAILGAQRATKILGIFARLDKRDHKPQYLVHLPRIEAYLSKNLAHPALAELAQWYKTNVLPQLHEASDVPTMGNTP